MSKLQSFKRLLAEDFAEKDRPLITKVASSMNVFAEDVLNAFNKNLSIEDNLSLNKKDFTVSVDSGGVPSAITKVATGLSSTCRGTSVIYALNTTNPSHTPTGTPFISFVESTTGIITISKITNLQASETYTIRIILYP